MSRPRDIALVLVACAIATPVLAQGDACVTKNRIYSTQVIDSRTILVTDMQKKQYTVHMSGTCVGLDRTAVNLSWRTKTELGCIGLGDSVGYSMPGEGTQVQIRPNLQSTCFIESVTAGAPAKGE